MKNIIYLNNFMSLDIVKKRNNKNTYSQPANNKITGILQALSYENNVEILSSGLVNGKSLKFHKKYTEKYLGHDVTYCSIIEFPFLNTLSSIISMYKEVKLKNKAKKIDNIIFYNYKPEVAWTAYLAKKILRIPITIEYEDGYSNVDGVKGLKAFIFNYTEKIISKAVDSAILVNSKLCNQYNVPSAVVRGVVNLEFYDKCQNYKKSKNDKFTILYCGGLDNERGINVFLESLKYLNIDCRVIITGKGEIVISDPRIDFRGFIDYEEVQNLMIEADVLVQCQLANHNFADVSFPSKLFEYIATGNMIISSDMEEVKNFAGDAISYYSNDDPKGLANEILKLYQKTGKQIDLLSDLRNQNLPKNIGKMLEEILSKKEE